MAIVVVDRFSGEVGAMVVGPDGVRGLQPCDAGARRSIVAQMSDLSRCLKPAEKSIV
ncbi:hypothetical protein ACNKHX_00955 [Shigella flexneri]